MDDVGRRLRRRGNVAARLAATSSGMPDIDAVVRFSADVYGSGSSFSTDCGGG